MMSPGELADEHRYQRDAATISKMRKLAHLLGYAIAAHGSRSEKDLDIIAVPWTADAKSAMELVAAFVYEHGEEPALLHRGERVSETTTGEIKSNKPHGRIATILIREEDHRHIDLSIMPRFVPATSCAQCDMHNRGCILPTIDGRPTLSHCFIPRKEADMATPQPLKLDSGEVKTAMRLRKASSCSTCGNARHNPGMGGPGDGFLECNANVLCRFGVEQTQVCDHYNGAHGPKAMAR